MSIKLISFIGDMGDRDSITQNGVVFHKDEKVEVDSDQVDLSPWFAGNSSFLIEDAPSDSDDEATERAALMTKLDDLEINYRKNSSIATLRKVVADLENDASGETTEA